MEEMSSTVVPLGSLAILFAGIAFLVILKKAILAREADKVIKNRMAEKLALRNRPLVEQKQRLEELLKK